MLAFKTIFLIASLISGIAIYIPYYIGILKKEIKPHFFSWSTWAILTAIGFVSSVSSGGGGGSWIFALESVLCISVAIVALFRGEKNITRLDWFFFITAILVMLIYISTKNAVLSVILAALIDFFGFLPTFRKSFSKPKEESVLSYFFSGLGFLFSIGALLDYSFVTMFYPSTLVITNMALVIFLLMRRKK
jgi:hypothetical protein